jgi:hypothetical protein
MELFDGWNSPDVYKGSKDDIIEEMGYYLKMNPEEAAGHLERALQVKQSGNYPDYITLNHYGVYKTITINVLD